MSRSDSCQQCAEEAVLSDKPTHVALMLPSLQGKVTFGTIHSQFTPKSLLHSARRLRPHVVRASQQQQSSTAVPSAAAAGSFQWSSNVSRRINLDLAIEEAVAGALSSKAAGWEPELAIVFLSSAYVAEYDQLVQLLRQRVPSLKHIFGSTVGLTKQAISLYAVLQCPARESALLGQPSNRTVSRILHACFLAAAGRYRVGLMLNLLRHLCVKAWVPQRLHLQPANLCSGLLNKYATAPG